MIDIFLILELKFDPMVTNVWKQLFHTIFPMSVHSPSDVRRLAVE